MTLTYKARLAKVKVDLHAKNEGRRSNGSARREVTDGQTDGWTERWTDATKYIISLASQSIKSKELVSYCVQKAYGAF